MGLHINQRCESHLRISPQTPPMLSHPEEEERRQRWCYQHDPGSVAPADHQVTLC